MENEVVKTNEANDDSTQKSSEIEIDQEKLNQWIEKLRLDQNLPLGILGGLIATIIGGILWAAITVATEYQIGFMAVAIGLMVGFAVRITGRGLDKIFGIMGALLSVFGCILGNFLSLVGFAANEEGYGYLETLRMIDYSIIPDIMLSTFSPMDILFYGLAIYEGYRFSFRKITEEELLKFRTVKSNP